LVLPGGSALGFLAQFFVKPAQMSNPKLIMLVEWSVAETLV
jgi:hypothetical protein